MAPTMWSIESNQGSKIKKNYPESDHVVKRRKQQKTTPTETLPDWLPQKHYPELVWIFFYYPELENTVFRNILCILG